MGKLAIRLVGLVVALSGAALLAFLAKALYTPSERWVDVLVAINMPTMLILTLTGTAMFAGGLWMCLGQRPPDARA